MGEELHRLLKRQVERSNVDLMATDEGRKLLESIDKTYKQFERERKILEVNAKRMLEKISQSNDNLHSIIGTLDGFNYHVSHDLKTSMINAVGLSKMIKKYVGTGNKEKVTEVVDKLINNSGKGLALIEKFLRISKFDTNLNDQELEPIDLKSVINTIIADLDLTGKFEIEYTRADFEKIYAKEIGITSLFQNLITNSYKYRKKEERLKIEIRFVSEGNHDIIYFKDNGIGIDMKVNKNKLFQPFVRIANDLNEEGTGVGLFLVKKVMTEHGGNVTVSSEPGIGTEFMLTF